MASNGKPMVALRRVHRFFGSTRAVNDISFEVYQGEVFGYIGPNGAGKTTSMRILATLDLPTFGDALVDGFSVVNDPDRVRRRLGFMPDNFGTYHNVNCREYLDFFARAYGLMGPERDRAMRHVMGFTGLDKLAEKPIRGLSKGMKQRLCLGRAMIHDPAVLILDEPAAGLDPRARIELRQMIRELAERGKTMLVSSHILTELGEMCDRVAIIEVGRLIAVGSVAEIHQRATPLNADVKIEVKLRLLSGFDSAIEWLQKHPSVHAPRLEGEFIRLALDGDRTEQAVLLRELIGAGFAVSDFGGHAKSLEEVFLHVTRGVVQ